MRSTEKVLLGLVFLGFCLQFLAPFVGSKAVLAFPVWALALSYIFGGYWLLRPKGAPGKFLNALAGIAIGTSLLMLPFTVRLRVNTLAETLPIANALFFVALALYLAVKKGPLGSHNKGLLIRSFSILVIAVFFTYQPVTFKVYRVVLKALNQGDEPLVANLEMFDQKAKFDEAYDNGNCKEALVHAKKANQAGRVWLGVSEIHEENQKKMEALLAKVARDSTTQAAQIGKMLSGITSGSELWKISGTYISLYKAYVCIANELFDRKDYHAALQNYMDADKALNACDHGSQYWELERARSTNRIGQCHEELLDFRLADSCYYTAIKEYREILDTIDQEVLSFYSNIAGSLSAQSRYSESNEILKEIIFLLSQDSLINRNDLADSHRALALNHLNTDSLPQAMATITSMRKYLEKDSLEFCSASMLEGVCYYKWSRYLKADSVLTATLNCYQSWGEPAQPLILGSRLILAKVKIALAQYEEAGEHISMGLQNTQNEHGELSSLYVDFLKEQAHLDKIFGRYDDARKAYVKAEKMYIKQLGTGNHKLPELLAEMADLEVILDEATEAKNLVDRSLEIAGDYTDLDKPSLAGIINVAAYVNYHNYLLRIADSLYSQTLTMHEYHPLANLRAYATALSGLGLVMMERSQYAVADSLFIKSTQLYQDIFSERHPLTAGVYLNRAHLKLAQGRLIEAEELINRSLHINEQFFYPGHDVFGDHKSAFGELYLKKGDKKLARSYFNEALEIYLKKFENQHSKVKITKARLAVLQ